MSRRRLWILLVACAAACGGGGGGGPPPTATISGALQLPGAAPLRAVGRTVLDAAPFAGTPSGRLDAGEAHAYRALAAGGPVRVRGGDAVLHDLETGRVARSLVLPAGAPFDVVVAGPGAYALALEPALGDTTPRALPAAYLDAGDGCVPGEIVARPVAGVSAHDVARAAGLTCLRARGPLCLLHDADAADPCALAARCARLVASGLVAFAEPNLRRRLAGRPSDPLYGEQWALEHIRMPDAWELKTDAAHVAAVVDSGIRMHPDVVDALVPGYDFVDDDDDPTDETIDFAHGTQVVGVLAATANNGQGLAGVCWSARVMPVRAFGTTGFGTSFDIANAILFAAGLDNDSGLLPDEGARVINLSFAATTRTQVEEDACIAARAAGALLVAAAGNGASTLVRYPAGYASVLSIAATGIDGGPTTYSNRGPWIDLAAPGGTNTNGLRVTGVDDDDAFAYLFVNGTSFASPHVAGVALLALCVRDMTVDELEQLLLATARDLGEAGPDDRTGAGMLDAHAALLAAAEQPAPVLGAFESVQVRLREEPGGAVFLLAVTSQESGLAWSLTGVPAGTYRLEAGTDRDFDGALDEPGEVFGRWLDGLGGETFTVAPGEQRDDLDFTIVPRN